MSFETFDLDPTLERAVASLGFERPTAIQQQVIPAAMDARDILASAPTGTGKTVAFLLPALQHLLDYPRRGPGAARVLILAPTRELAVQVGEDAKNLAHYTPLATGVITGGISYREHDDLLEKNLDLLVATPGRLMEYLENEQFHARDVEVLILDEADRMLDMGFGPVVEQIAAEARWRKQTFLLSATLEGRGVERFAAELLNEPVRISVEPPRRERKKIHEYIHLADNAQHKLALLDHILRSDPVSRTLIFVKTRERLMALVADLQRLDHQVAYLRGEMPQDKRLDQIKRFRQGKTPVLVATDVAARGLDIDDISHVINYDLPRTADVYVHRIGRTARAGRKGTAISLVEAHDMPPLARIERFTQQELPRRIIEELRPRHKEARLPKKKKKPKSKRGAKALKRPARAKKK